MLLHLPDRHDAETVIKAMIEAMQASLCPLPQLDCQRSERGRPPM
jgi:hypothetical protein